MALLGVVLLVVLLIPVFVILGDVPRRRAAARRLDDVRLIAPGTDALERRIELLEGEVEDLTRALDALREEHQFFQRLLEDNPPRRPPPSRPGA
jgi:hypothetical protein